MTTFIIIGVNNKMMKIPFGITLIIILLALPFTSALDQNGFYQQSIHSENDENTLPTIQEDISLPPPKLPSILLEDVIARRGSVRDFKRQEISLENISSILWAAYGNVSGDKSVESIDGRHAIKIYVLMEKNAYFYNASNHSLLFFRRGRYRWLGDYDTASIKLGLVWDTSVCKNENIAAAEIGMIGQNVYFMANALGLGTVTTAQKVNQLRLLRLPRGEQPMIIMPIGIPVNDYDLTYSSYTSSLPFPETNTLSFVDALNEKQTWPYLSGSLTEREKSQILWAAYGYSYLYDNLGDTRHRTLPSSMGTYPLEIYYANEDAFYQYQPMDHSIKPIINMDLRPNISDASYPWMQNAETIIIALNYSKDNYSWAWFYEAGAIWHNILLESAALGLYANVIVNFDLEKLQSTINISDVEPIMIIQVGDKQGFDNDLPKITINSPKEKTLYLFGREMTRSPMIIIVGPMDAQILVNDTSFKIAECFVDGEFIGESYTESFNMRFPAKFFKQCQFRIVARDYFGNETSTSFDFFKVL